MNRIVHALILAAFAATPGLATAQEKPTSVVLVHGAFADGSGWRAVHDLLAREGYEVLVVQNPTESLAGDVAATRRAIAAARHPVVLVGHSYAGMVITEAGADPKVRSLVYLAAFAPDVGESVATLSQTPPAPGESHAPLLPPRDGFLIVDPEKFPAAFAADVDPGVTRFMAVSQTPWGLAAVQAPVATAAWRDRPSRFMVAAQDRMIPPSAQRAMAGRAGATVVEIASSHAVMLSHPAEVAALIEDAAGAAD